MNLTATMSGYGNETANLALDGKGYGTDNEFCAVTNYTVMDGSILSSLTLSHLHDPLWPDVIGLPDLDKFGRRRRRRNVAGKRVGDVMFVFLFEYHANTARAYISDKIP